MSHCSACPSVSYSSNKCQHCQDVYQRYQSLYGYYSYLCYKGHRWPPWNGKQLSSQWPSPSPPHPKTSRQVRLSLKSKSIIFFESEGILHKEFTEVHSVKITVHARGPRCLTEDAKKKCPHKWHTQDWLLHHNLQGHSGFYVQQFTAENNMAMVPHPLLPQPSSLQLLPLLKDERPITGTQS